MEEGTRIDLRCEAAADRSLELRYSWKKDNADVIYNERIEWRESLNVLTIADMTSDDSGIYTCVAYTPGPKNSEDKASARIDLTGKTAKTWPRVTSLQSLCFISHLNHQKHSLIKVLTLIMTNFLFLFY